MPNMKIPDVAIRRLPVYLRVLLELGEKDEEIISSAELARLTGFSSEQIRKDLAYFGAFGTRGVGYSVEILIQRIKRILNLHEVVEVALVGAGNLGTAFARYNLNAHQDVRITAIFDNDWGKIGKNIADVEILPMDNLSGVIKERGIKMAIIAVPAFAAQEVANTLVNVGIEAILNFSPTKLNTPGHVSVQNIDLSIELQSLAYYTSSDDKDLE